MFVCLFLTLARAEFRENEFNHFMNSSYWFSILPLSATKAAEVCKGLGAELVSVESQLEDAYLTSVITTINKKYGKHFLLCYL